MPLPTHSELLATVSDFVADRAHDLDDASESFEYDFSYAEVTGRMYDNRFEVEDITDIRIEYDGSTKCINSDFDSDLTNFIEDLLAEHAGNGPEVNFDTMLAAIGVSVQDRLHDTVILKNVDGQLKAVNYNDIARSVLDDMARYFNEKGYTNDPTV